MPVGRIEYLHLGPMTFEEFLTATSPDLLPFLQRATAAADAIPATAHARLLTCQREYLFVGGMPEAVLAFSGNRRLQDVIEVQRSIAATFKDDFARYASQSALIRLHRVFEAAPRAVGRKVKYSFFAKDETAREVRAAIDLLAKARVLARVSHSHCSGVPLAADVDESCYKLLFLDIGLMNRVCGLDWRTVSALDERGLVNEGPMAEQFVGQHLLYAEGGLEEPRLYYWLREAKSANAEVDYVLARGLRIVPVEVKAGQSGTLRSVLQFVQDKRAPVALRFDLNPPSVQRVRHRLRQAAGTAEVELDLISLPLYLVGQTPRVLDEHLAGLLPA
jgi:predicted AAA+ superfamily ATPase